MSFYDYSRTAGVIEIFTLKNYINLWTDPYYLEITFRTFRISIIVMLVTLLAGFPVALYMSRAGDRARAVITLLILSPLLISVVVRSFGWLIILGPNGLIDKTVQLLGFDSGNLMYSETAIIIGLVNVFLPYMVLSVVASLQSIDGALSLAAASLGASPAIVFRRITLPLSMPGIVAGSLIVFCLSSSAYVTPVMLGGASLKVLPVLTYQQTLILQNWPFAAAIAFSLLIIVLTIVGIQVRLLRNTKVGVTLR